MGANGIVDDLLLVKYVSGVETMLAGSNMRCNAYVSGPGWR